MNSYIIKLLLPVIALFLLSGFSFGEFSPWNAGVRTGDELIDSGYTHHPSGVYNGAQGGAYFLLRFFQIFISSQDGPNCRHDPVCSAYGRNAVITHGAFLGSVLAGDRLLRCNPFYPPSKDPVPDKPFSK